LSDDFTTHLACDTENNIWACSALGLDKISIKNGMPVVENLTKQNNIYQSVFKIIIDKNNTAWGAVSNGLIKITSEKKQPVSYSPTLMVSLIKAGKDTIPGLPIASLSHKQNNLSSILLLHLSLMKNKFYIVTGYREAAMISGQSHRTMLLFHLLISSG
jgi:hypothetical protein